LFHFIVGNSTFLDMRGIFSNNTSLKVLDLSKSNDLNSAVIDLPTEIQHNTVLEII